MQDRMVFYRVFFYLWHETVKQAGLVSMIKKTEYMYCKYLNMYLHSNGPVTYGTQSLKKMKVRLERAH